jgi:hypothetical protein
VPIITGLLNKATITRGEVLRETAWDALFLFSTLVLGPHKPGAASSTVKTEVAARLDLWNKGKFEKLSIRAKNAKADKSKSHRAAKRAARLLHKNQFANATQLAGSLGIAEAHEDTIKGIEPMFLEPC